MIPNKSAHYDDEIVHCHCRMPELEGSPMIECITCFNWCHVNCESVDIESIDSDVECHCKICMGQMKFFLKKNNKKNKAIAFVYYFYDCIIKKLHKNLC